MNPYFINNVLNLSFQEEHYHFMLSPGKYRLEAYGASGGSPSNRETSARTTDKTKACISESIVKKFNGNAICNPQNSQGGAGGYSSGILTLFKRTNIYVVIGGKGINPETSGTHQGGYNGGGRSCERAGSGGGATDFRLLRDSLYTRVLVAGGGGGSDDPGNTYKGPNDGSGGSGGLPSQAMWNDGDYQGEKYEATSLTGYSFGQGQNHILVLVILNMLEQEVDFLVVFQ